jgi:hypothetical protein
MLGAAVAPYSGADGNGDGMVSQLDYDIWRNNFAATIASLALSIAENVEEHRATAYSSAVDEALVDIANEQPPLIANGFTFGEPIGELDRRPSCRPGLA